MDAAYLLRTSRSASMVQATGGDDIKPRRSKRGRGSSVASSEGSQRSGSVVNKGRPKIEARHIVIQRKKVSGKTEKVDEPKLKLQYAINREEEEELNKSDHESSEEEGQEDEIKSSSSNSDEGKSYIIPEDDDLSTVGIMEEV